MLSTEIQQRDRLPTDDGANPADRGKERPGWNGLLLSAVAIVGEELLRRWLRGSKKGKGGGGGGGRGRRS